MRAAVVFIPDAVTTLSRGTEPRIALWLGVYAFGFGALLITLSFRLRTWARLVLAES